uniref:PDZ domain-containing protein n=1 Tax=Alexandrium monilatum TaxID=311494 RepID=A0A7S4VSP4_9DINO
MGTRPLRAAAAAPLALAAVALLRLSASWPSFAVGGQRRPRPPSALQAPCSDSNLDSAPRGQPASSSSLGTSVAFPGSQPATASPSAPETPDLSADSLRSLLVQLCALALGCLVGVSAALANVSTDVENVDAALGFVKRNYYDQTFNGQEWEAFQGRYLTKAEKGESAKKLTREIVNSLGDRYSRVIDAASFERLMAYDPLGIGVVLARNESSEVIVSSPPFANSAAAKVGLRQGDIVISIDGTPFANESLFAVMDRVAQADSPQVRLALRRGSATEPVKLWEETVPRARSSTPQSKVDAGVVPAVGPGNHRVGYLRLKSFGARSALDMADALGHLREEGADELVLDLRGNLGGSFQAALEIAALFLEPNSVATHVQTPAAGDRPLKVNGNAGTAQQPLVVLVDQQSASASEVLAAALRGNCRAPLLGSKTYGKAAVQGVFGLPNREALVLTVAKYSGPSGLAIADGLRPDGEGPVGPLKSAAAATGLSLELSPSDYAGVDFSAGRTGSLRTCVPERA